mmetsp:Transcript_60293/g.138352  ORF Transcript_60293/g.138352 Transcript_60293/m.138352 type:complete len:87 (+) Transcript_60293:117-377(+)
MLLDGIKSSAEDSAHFAARQVSDTKGIPVCSPAIRASKPNRKHGRNYQLRGRDAATDRASTCVREHHEHVVAPLMRPSTTWASERT